MSGLEPVVLVVEDEPQMQRFLRASLDAHGYKIVLASSGREAIALVASHQPALVLLDLGLPDLDGIEVTRKLREWSQLPIIVISARGREDDKVSALDSGADDYLTKPFGVNELLARMRVALRHHQAAPDEPTLTIGELTIDRVRREVSMAGREVRLTPIEYRLLGLLAEHAGKVLTHRQILKEIWGPGHGDDAHYVRVHMALLRKKLERDPARPMLIITEPGVGYRLRAP
jgi:two-component system KDP operon response regulator KdpE